MNESQKLVVKRPVSISKKSNPWTPLKKKAVEDYISELQKLLKLSDWTITMNWDLNADEYAYATNDPLPDSRHATISISNRFFSLSGKLQTQTLVHELIHCHLQSLTDLAENTVESLTNEAGSGIFVIANSQCVEIATDALADAIAPLVPQFKLPAEAKAIKVKVEVKDKPLVTSKVKPKKGQAIKAKASNKKLS